MIELLQSPKLWIVVAWLGAAAFVHFRGRVRHSWSRQLLDHSTLLAPYNALVYLFSAVPNRPYLDRTAFPELDVLREHWQEIRDEAVALVDGGHARASAERNDIAFNAFFKRGWTRFYVKWYGAPLASARDVCPRTTALVESIPSIHAALFAVMAPNSRLGEHRDPFAGSLRYHLGLVTPNDDRCRIWVDDEPHTWHDGEDVVFDETYVHRARNDTESTRIILFCDVARPVRFAPFRWLNEFVARRIVPATQTANVPGERIGFVNRFAALFERQKRVAKRIKHWNRPVYRVLKLTLFTAIAAGLWFAF